MIERGDEIMVHDHKGRQLVTVVGFQDGTGDLLIDDGTDDLDTPRFCSREQIVDNKNENS